MIHNFSNICCFTFILFTNLIFVVVSLRDCLPLLINSRPVRIIVNQYEARAASHHHRLQSLVSQYVDMAKRNASVVHIEYGSASPKIGDYNITASLVLAVTDSSSNSSDDCVNNGPILPSNNLLQAKQCFKIEYIIQDINECITGLHRCHSSAPLCIKVPGTYHCACDTAGGDFGVEGSGRAVDVARTWSVPKESRCRSDATASSRWQAKGVFELVLDGVKRWMSRGEDAKGEEAEKVNGRGCGGEKTSTKCCEKICRELLPPPLSFPDCLEACKADFQCSNDPCKAINGHSNLCSDAQQHISLTAVFCTSDAECLPNHTIFSYQCRCNDGFIGDGLSCQRVNLKAPSGVLSGLMTRSGGEVDYCAMSQHVEVGNAEGRMESRLIVGHTCDSSCMCMNSASDKGYRCGASVGFVAVSNPFGLPLPLDHSTLRAPHPHLSEAVTPSSMNQKWRGPKEKSSVLPQSQSQSQSLPLSLHYRLDNNTACFRLDGSDVISLEGPTTITLEQGQQYRHEGQGGGSEQWEWDGLRLHWKARSMLFGPNGVEGNVSDDRVVFSESWGEDSGPASLDGSGVHIHHSFAHCPYMTQIGTHTVTYTISTPWLSPHRSAISLTRQVVVTDVNECTYTGNASHFHAACDPIAFCQNLPGSYKCQCPPGFEGNGVRDDGGGPEEGDLILLEEGDKKLSGDGRGCRDMLAPVLQCRGGGCSGLRLSAVDFSGIVGFGMAPSVFDPAQVPAATSVPMSRDALRLPFVVPSDESRMSQRELLSFLEERKYDLCGDSNCFEAYDIVQVKVTGGSGVADSVDAYREKRVSLMSRVHMGRVQAVRVGGRGKWGFEIPCSVQDEAGNSAKLVLYVEVVFLDAADLISHSQLLSVLVRRLRWAMVVLCAMCCALGIWIARSGLRPWVDGDSGSGGGGLDDDRDGEDDYGGTCCKRTWHSLHSSTPPH